MQFGDGPTAVFGDDRCIDVTDLKEGWEGAASRMNRESEDLPEWIFGDDCEDGGGPWFYLFCG